MNFLYEMYTTKSGSNVFLGYKKVAADCKEDALLCAQEAAGPDVRLYPVYINEADPYAR
jgi:hypothetical protein